MRFLEFKVFSGLRSYSKQPIRRRRKMLRAALALEANDTDVSNTLAWIYVAGPVELRDLKQALTLIQKAVDLDRGQGAYLDSLGWVYFRLGRLSEAEDNVRRAIVRTPRGEPGSAVIERGRRLRIDRVRGSDDPVVDRQDARQIILDRIADLH